MIENFQAWMVDTKAEDSAHRAQMVELSEKDLPEGDVTVKVEYSCLNYKDAAAIKGSGRILRVEKCVPGIDLAGKVVASSDDKVKEGSDVLVTGFGIGEDRHGGLAKYARVPSSFVTAMPEGLDARKAMSFGTAGFTAGLSVMALVEHGVKKDADVLVTSVGGGVGSFSAALVTAQGFKLHSVTRNQRKEYAESFSPTSVIDREEFISNIRPLDKAQWDAGIDTAGGQVLAKLVSQVKPEGIVTCCGVTAGADVNTTVMPFILRGITLRGINSVYVPQDGRQKVWKFLSDHLEALEKVNIEEIGIEDVLESAADLINGKVRGRVLVKVGG